MIEELKAEIDSLNARISELSQREKSISNEITAKGEELEQAIADGADTAEIIGNIRGLEAEKSAIPGAVSKLKEKRRLAKNRLATQEAAEAKERLNTAAEQIREPVEVVAEALEALAAEIEALPERDRDTFAVLRLPNKAARISALPDILRGYIDREARERAMAIDTTALHRQAPAPEPTPEMQPNFSPIGRVFGNL